MPVVVWVSKAVTTTCATGQYDKAVIPAINASVIVDIIDIIIIIIIAAIVVIVVVLVAVVVVVIVVRWSSSSSFSS